MALFKIRKVGNQKRSSNIVLGLYRQVSTIVVSSTNKYKYISSRTIYSPKDYLNYSKICRSREQTFKMIRGDPAYSFGKILSFFYMFRQKNFGTITELEVDSHNRFKYYFMALDVLIWGWEHYWPRGFG